MIICCNADVNISENGKANVWNSLVHILNCCIFCCYIMTSMWWTFSLQPNQTRLWSALQQMIINCEPYAKIARVGKSASCTLSHLVIRTCWVLNGVYFIFVFIYDIFFKEASASWHSSGFSFDLWILIDRSRGAIFVYRQFIAEAPAGTICVRVKIIQIQEVPVPSLLKENPLLCHEADASLKKIS
jgi:hypothetical protein